MEVFFSDTLKKVLQRWIFSVNVHKFDLGVEKKSAQSTI